MTELRFDAIGGASGDMILGVLLELSGKSGELMEALRDILPDACFDVVSEKVVERGVAAVRAHVVLGDGAGSNDAGGGAGHHHHGENHRDFKTIKAMIEASGLPKPVKETSVAVFERLAKAEGKVHGKPPEEVHFHEVGAVDSIIDVVGACQLLWLLNIDRVRVSPLPVGQGELKCEHGVMPIPAPATMKLLNGMPIIQTDEPFELVTPTAAALLSTWGGSSPPPTSSSPLVVRSCVHGAGHRRLKSRPNILRATILESDDLEGPWQTDQRMVLETNIDDATPELMGALSEKLIDAGALDVTVTPTQMKKQRPGFLLSVICGEEIQNNLIRLIFREGATFGIRRRLVDRVVLDRDIVETSTPHGTVKVKIGKLGDEIVSVAPEFDDCVKAAEANDVPVKRVFAAALERARVIVDKTIPQ